MALYRKKHLQKLTPWVDGFPMDSVSISPADLKNGSPKKGDMIATNPKDATDMWLVAKVFFNDNYELHNEKVGNIMTKEQVSTRAMKALLMTNDIGDAPHKTQRVGKHYEVIIAIGKDHTATLTLDESAYFELCKIVDE
jgi:hypothetical protein